jgi:ribonuclease HII
MQQHEFFHERPTGLVAGVDEAGRGPLAGPVMAAAVILDPACPIEGLDDSKKLSEAQRERLSDVIKLQAMSWCIALADVEEIDRLNILQASMLAMQRAVAGLHIQPQHILVDGNRAPRFKVPATPIVGGDALEPAISAASILAKVARDHQMIKLDADYPGYGFAIHKGYPTAKHRKALAQLGLCDIHRRSYGPVKALLPTADLFGM